MKYNKILSWLLTAAMVLAMTAPTAMAAFPDVPADHWAAKFIDDTAAKEVFVGIDGKFVPDRLITASEVLATCARFSVGRALCAEIGRDRAAQINTLMGTVWVGDGKGTNQSDWTGEQYWFANEYAACLETGILSYPELKELHQSGALLKPITKEDFALYLVRAMQLEPMAKGLSNVTLSFKDKADITPGREPYIYLLNMYSIVAGTDTGKFEPKSAVNRAVAATMLSKATTFMDERDINVEVANYTDYEWVAGTILSATEGSKGVLLLTLVSDLSGTATISVPTTTPVYENSMLAEKTRLKAGTYARVCMDSSGAPISVRLSGSVQTITGNVVGISDSAILLSVNGVSQTVGYDRFTEVQVGKKVGERSLLDLDAGYTSAVCRINQLGHLVAVQLTGGTRKEEAIISSVETLTGGGATLVVSGFNGELQRLSVPLGAVITSNGVTVSNFNTSYAGSYISMRISNDTNAVVSAAVDTVTQYIQGAVKGSGTDNGVNTVTIANLVTNKATTYKLTTDATFTFNDVPVSYGAIQKDFYVTIRLTGGEIATLAAYPGSTTTTGTITGITFPTGTTKEIISVTKADGVVVPVELQLASPPEVRRNGKTSSLDKLRTGDAITVTIRYSAVTLIDTTAQSANMGGTIAELAQTVEGVTIKVDLDGGGTASYAITSGVSITQNSKTISMYDLRAGYHIAMVTNGDQVASIDVDKTTSNTNQLTGTIILLNNTDKTFLFRVDGTESPVTVSVPSGTTINDAGGGSVSLSKLVTGDRLDIYGSYVNGEFKATLVIRK